MMRLSLRAKIMICCVSLVALLDLMVVMFVRSRLSRELRAECVLKGRNMAVNLAARSEHLVLTDGFVSLMQMVADLRDSDEDVAYAYVMDRKERVLAHTFGGGFPADLVGVNTPRPGDEWSKESLDTAEEGLVHDIAVPILGGRVGVVHVGVSERRIERTIAHFTSRIVVMAGIVLLLALGLTAVVSWVVTQPVRTLTEATRKIRDGSLGQRVVATTNDELGELVESFNEMSDELLRQHKVLEDRNRRIRIAREQATWERDKLRAIIDSMVEGVIFVDAEGRISLCNQSAERIWRTEARPLLGAPLLECYSPERRAKVAAILEEAKKNPGFSLDHPMEQPRGEKTYLGTCSSVHSEDGRYLGLVLLNLDISDRVTLEQEQKRLREQLFQQEKMVVVGQIAASVAHELNTPLSTMLLRSQLMRDALGAGCDLADLEVIESEARRCRRIIESLLGLARRSEGAIAETDMNSVVLGSLSLIENDLELKGIVVQTDYAGNGATVWVDGDQIQQVLLNLITNAADAMPDGGHLRIQTRSDDECIEVRVTDDGCGMEENVLKQAFDPFFTSKPRGKGTGLGLPICRRIVEEHEGKIEIESEAGHGTTVWIRLPRAPAKGDIDA